MAFPQLKKQLGINNEEISPYEYDEGASGGDLLKSFISDKAPPSEFSSNGGGIQSITSPIDYLAGRLGATLGKTAGREALSEGATKYLTSGEGSLGRVGSIGTDVQPEMGMADRIRRASQNSNVRFAQPAIQQEERYAADAPKTYWDKVKEKANEKGIASNPGTKEAFERQKQATQELLKKRKEEQYSEYLKKIKGDN